MVRNGYEAVVLVKFVGTVEDTLDGNAVMLVDASLGIGKAGTIGPMVGVPNVVDCTAGTSLVVGAGANAILELVDIGMIAEVMLAAIVDMAAGKGFDGEGCGLPAAFIVKLWLSKLLVPFVS